MKTSVPPSHEHPFAQYVRILGKGKKGTRALTQDEAFEAMSMIMSHQVLDAQLGAFLMLMRVKEESADELLGFVKAVKQYIKPDMSITPDLDWSSYAGKRRHLPWYLLSILLLAGQGHRVFIHGASGHTIDRLYTEDVFRELGLPIAENWQQCQQQLQQQHFSYYPLRVLCPRLHQIIELRNVMGLRSPVHTLARLLNPCEAEHVVQGIFHPGYRPVHQTAALSLGYKKVAVIKGEAGEIERNPDTDCLVQSVRGAELLDETWPAMFKHRHVKETSLSVASLVHCWRGKSHHDYGEAAAIGTTAIVLTLLGKASNQSEAQEMAQQMWTERNRSLL